jgi:hypothetical protein
MLPSHLQMQHHEGVAHPGAVAAPILLGTIMGAPRTALGVVPLLDHLAVATSTPTPSTCVLLDCLTLVAKITHDGKFVSSWATQPMFAVFGLRKTTSLTHVLPPWPHPLLAPI